MAAALGLHLIFQMHAGRSCAYQFARGAGNIESAAEPGIGVHQQRQGTCGGHAAHILAHVIQGGDP